MLMTIAKFEARPEFRMKLLELELALALVEHSRAETGCLEHGCYQDITNADRLLMAGRWTNQEVLENYYESEQFRQLVTQFADWVVEAPPSVSLYEVVEMDR
ncbi:MAG TPA: antibiotic biosynthesis monooxygenase, partial [Candidatus Competibacteraceae bacterium]|nr:antibiotic biosynthesis monooxygenase [Candidatus Competibacteraceae bacterium]